jgi:hypothetical protein
MSLDPPTLESDLRKLRPAQLDESYLARLESCAEGTWKELDPVEIVLEKRLRACTPARLPAGLTASLESVLDGVRFPNDEKIVPFPTQQASSSRGNRGWWGAAASVAITGAITALMMPSGHDSRPVAGTSPDSRSTRPSIASEKLIPAGFNRGLSEASDEGVIWQSNNRPHNVLKVVYMDRVTLKDANGATVEVEQPTVEYILVPAKTD